MEKKEQLWSNIIERKWKDSVVVVAVDVVYVVAQALTVPT